MQEPGGLSPIPWHSITPVQSDHMNMLKDPRLLLRVLELLAESGTTGLGQPA